MPDCADHLISRADPSFEYTRLEKIGEGASGTVFSGWTAAGGKVAIKMVPLTTSTNMRVVKNEISIMKSSCHPNIVEYANSHIRDHSLWVCSQDNDE